MFSRVLLLVVCWLRLSASTQEGVGSIPGQGTKIPHVLCLCGQKESIPSDPMTFFFLGGGNIFDLVSMSN